MMVLLADSMQKKKKKTSIFTKSPQFLREKPSKKYLASHRSPTLCPKSDNLESNTHKLEERSIKRERERGSILIGSFDDRW